MDHLECGPFFDNHAVFGDVDDDDELSCDTLLVDLKPSEPALAIVNDLKPALGIADSSLVLTTDDFAFQAGASQTYEEDSPENNTKASPPTDHVSDESLMNPLTNPLSYLLLRLVGTN